MRPFPFPVCATIVLTCALSTVCATATLATSESAALYDLTIETGMPHLEESLRYTRTKIRQCLTRDRLATAFPALAYESLQSCRLEAPEMSSHGAEYRLICSGSSGTTGRATWSFEEHRSFGTLEIKLGGKNMTFFQRIDAVHVGPCR
jgi:hypothetical protein